MKDGTGVKPAEQQEFICVATFLPIKSWKHIIPFMMLSPKVLKQIKNSKGIVNYAVKANFAKKFFWTLSIWNDKESVRLFVPAEPHAPCHQKAPKGPGMGSYNNNWIERHCKTLYVNTSANISFLQQGIKNRNKLKGL
jgi:hypothetical protein